MEKSNSLINIAKALIDFQSKVSKIDKDSNNPFFKSKYASLSHIQESIQKPLSDAGIAYSQFPEGSNGLTTILIHAESGEYMQSTYEMKPTKDDPQGRGSTITYQKRYALAAALGLNIDDDDDANAGSEKVDGKLTQMNQSNQSQDNRPWMTEKQYKQAMARITNGEQGVLASAEKALKMKKEYKAAMEEAEKGVAA